MSLIAASLYQYQYKMIYSTSRTHCAAADLLETSTSVPAPLILKDSSCLDVSSSDGRSMRAKREEIATAAAVGEPAMEQRSCRDQVEVRGNPERRPHEGPRRTSDAAAILWGRTFVFSFAQLQRSSRHSITTGPRPRR